MIRVKMMGNGDTCIIDNGSVFVFNRGGRLYEQSNLLIPKYTSGMITLPIISILSSGDHVEFALFQDDSNMEIRQTSMTMVQSSMFMMKVGKYIRMLQRDGECDGVRYNQAVYVFKEGTLLKSILDEITNLGGII